LSSKSTVIPSEKICTDECKIYFSPYLKEYTFHIFTIHFSQSPRNSTLINSKRIEKNSSTDIKIRRNEEE